MSRYRDQLRRAVCACLQTITASPTPHRSCAILSPPCGSLHTTLAVVLPTSVGKGILDIRVFKIIERHDHSWPDSEYSCRPQAPRPNPGTLTGKTYLASNCEALRRGLPGEVPPLDEGFQEGILSLMECLGSFSSLGGVGTLGISGAPCPVHTPCVSPSSS